LGIHPIDLAQLDSRFDASSVPFANLLVFTHGVDVADGNDGVDGG
jgi:hypothetical protein